MEVKTNTKLMMIILWNLLQQKIKMQRLMMIKKKKKVKK